MSVQSYIQGGNYSTPSPTKGAELGDPGLFCEFSSDAT